MVTAVNLLFTSKDQQRLITIEPSIMRKIIAAINVTLDGFCDHTEGIADDELHNHYAELLSSADAILYGRITYQLMEFWKTIVENPTGDRALDNFAEQIHRTPKIVFSNTLKSVDWETARLADRSPQEEVAELKQKPGKDIYVGSRSLIVSLTNLDLIDEYQLCIHPVLAGKGLPLYSNINKKISLKLLRTKTFGSGAVVLYYEPVKASY